MDPQLQAALVGLLGSLLVAGLTILGRNRSKSATVVRRSLDRQENLETYAFELRRQVKGAGGKPRRWPDGLRYLNRDDPDQGEDDDE